MDDVIVNISSPTNPTRERLQLMNTFSKYNHKQAEKDIRETTLFTIATINKKKYVGVTLNKQVKE